MIDSISAHSMQSQMLANMQRMQQAAGSGIQSNLPTASLSTPSFKEVLNGAIENVDRQQHVSSEKQRAIDMGTSDDLTGAMIESQKASVAFSAMLQVRNKLTQAFDDVLNTPL